jgi:hypothetical protein
MLTRCDLLCQVCLTEEEMWHEHLPNIVDHGHEHCRWQQEMQRDLQENLCTKDVHSALLEALLIHSNPIYSCARRGVPYLPW